MNQTSLETGEGIQSKRNKSKLWIVIAGLVTLLIGGAVTYAFFLSNTPKGTYFLAEYTTMKETSKEWKEKYGEQFEFQEAILKQPSLTELRLKGNFESEIMNSEMNMIQDLLKQASLVIKAEQDPVKEVSNSLISLEVGGTSAFDLEFYQSPEQYKLYLPMLYDKYFYMNSDQFGELMRKGDPSYDGPDTLQTTLKWDDLKLSVQEQEDLSKRYNTFFMSQLKDEYFYLTKDVSYEYQGETLKLREVALKLSPTETQEFLNSFIDQLIEDVELQQMIATRIKFLAEAGAFKGEFAPAEDLTDEAMVKEKILEGLQEAKEAMSQLQFTQGFESVLLIDKKNRIVDRSVSVELASEEEEPVRFLVATKNISKENITNKEFIVELKPLDQSGDRLAFELTESTEKQKEGSTENLQVNFVFELDGMTEFDAGLQLNSTFKGTAAKHEVDRDFSFSLSGTEVDHLPQISGSIKEEQDISLKDKYAKQVYDIELNVEGMPMALFFTLDSQVFLKDQIEVPSLSSAPQEGLNVVELTQFDMFSIVMQMQESLAGVLEGLGLGE
ncbi:DUF6583 family protein [Caldalkalibacillus mannanilyticus]|uniref:DUF6583 family protein n=1 Tax=Caldalkalibacillus mannanilyticus TaxID=1418 RepID=UPI0004687623|nr:DUF6583 family protein [Caldalkalibacillus mannanilyticus]